MIEDSEMQLTVEDASKDLKTVIGILGKKADLLDQVSLDLDKAVKFLDNNNKLFLRGYRVRRPYSYSSVHNVEKDIYHSWRIISEHAHPENASDAADQRVSQEFSELSSEIAQIGTLAHKVLLNKPLMDDEKAILNRLPQKFADAIKIFETAVENTPVTDSNRNDLTAFQAHVNFLRQLSKEISYDGEQLVQHNDGLIMRRAALTPAELRDYDAQAIKEGSELLAQSPQEAVETSDAFQKRVKEEGNRRTPLGREEIKPRGLLDRVLLRKAEKIYTTDL